MVPWWFPPTQPKGLNPLEFLSVGHSPCMVPWWFPSNLKGWIPLRGFSVLIIFPVMFVYDGVPEVTPQYQWGNGKPTRPRRRKVFFCAGSESMFGVGSEFLVLGVSRCWKWVDFWCWKWVVNLPPRYIKAEATTAPLAFRDPAWGMAIVFGMTLYPWNGSITVWKETWTKLTRCLQSRFVSPKLKGFGLQNLDSPRIDVENLHSIKTLRYKAENTNMEFPPKLLKTMKFRASSGNSRISQEPVNMMSWLLESQHIWLQYGMRLISSALLFHNSRMSKR